MDKNNNTTNNAPLFFSVIVPIFNAERDLNRCVDSILNQSYRQLEIILVDDGSTDQSGAICDQYIQKDGRIKVIHTNNGGLAKARKTGVHASTGDFVGFVDSDDYIEADTYQFMYNMLENDVVDMVGCGCIGEYPNERYQSLNQAAPGIYKGQKLEKLKNHMMFDIQKGMPAVYQSVCCKLFRRSILEEIMAVIDERITIGEDAAIVYPYLLRAKKILLSNYCFYHYIIRSDSMTRLHDVSIFEKIYIFYNYMSNYLRKYDSAYKLEMQLNRYMLHLIDMSIVNVYGIRHKQVKGIRVDSRLNGSKIILYGAGKVGKEYYRYILEKEDIKIVAWVDKNLAQEQVYFRGIQAPEMIKDSIFDYVLIAVDSEEVANEIKKELIKYCDNKKILWYPRIVQYNGEFEFLNEI